MTNLANGMKIYSLTADYHQPKDCRIYDLNHTKTS